MEVDLFHINEHDTLEPNNGKDLEGFQVNTWSIDFFVSEWLFQGEISMGTRDRDYMEKNEYKVIVDIEPKQAKTPVD